MQPAIAPGFIQIAGVIDAAEAAMLVACGVRYLGLPLRLPVHREDLTEAAAAAIIQSLNPPAFGILITYLEEADEIATFCRDLGARIVQLHGDIEANQLATLRRIDPALIIIKSLVVGQHSAAELEALAAHLSPWVDAFITDTFDPATGATGATGKTHDWSISRRLVEVCERPVILAGGLTPENVGSAIAAVRPAGVDAHTGVEDADGRKSRARVEQFLREARRAFEQLSRG